MAYSSNQVALPAGGALTDVEIPLETGTLVALGIKTGLGNNGAMSNYALASLVGEGGQDTEIDVQLVGGYLALNQGLSWTGRIQLEPSMAIRAQGRSFYGTDMRVFVVVEK